MYGILLIIAVVLNPQFNSYRKMNGDTHHNSLMNDLFCNLYV